MTFGTEFNYPDPDNGEPGDVMYDKIMISAIIFLLIVTLLLCLRFVYVSWFSERPTTSFRRTRRRSASTGPRFYFTGEEPERLTNVGLDSVILGTLPMFLYKSQNFSDGLECAVCLCEFEENEKGRLLPNCRHSFHVECIDMWFRSHSTCPLCRTAAQPEEPVLESAVSITIPGPITSGSQDNMNLEQAQTASRGEDCNQQNLTNRFSWGDRQKQMKTEMDEGISGRRSAMPQIAIDIPKKPDGFNSFSGEGHQPFSPNSSQRSSKSPVTRLRSLTKMVSRDRARTQVFDRSPELTVSLSSGDREGAQVCPSHRPAECVVENNEG